MRSYTALAGWLIHAQSIDGKRSDFVAQVEQLQAMMMNKIPLEAATAVPNKTVVPTVPQPPAVAQIADLGRMPPVQPTVNAR